MAKIRIHVNILRSGFGIKLGFQLKLWFYFHLRLGLRLYRCKFNLKVNITAVKV